MIRAALLLAALYRPLSVVNALLRFLGVLALPEETLHGINVIGARIHGDALPQIAGSFK